MNDEALQEDVLEELKWDPEVDAAHIGVAVKDGAVTLSGHVSSYAEKWAAVRAAERVEGVVAVADEIKVKLPSSSVRDDTDIAESIASMILTTDTLVVDKPEEEPEPAGHGHGHGH